MKSSAGDHYVALDHVRAVAIFLVFAWHFLRGYIHLVPMDYDAPYPFSLLIEGHAGVSLFMALSGYLFAKLIGDRQVHYPSFFWNRFLRLAPIVAIVMVYILYMVHMTGMGIGHWFWLVTTRVLRLPAGLWSVEAEAHFYILLPALLYLGRRNPLTLPGLVIGALALRAGIYFLEGTIREPSYYTLVGRIDQFLFGILAFRYRHWLTGKHFAAAAIAAAFFAFYAWFDRIGGFGGTADSSVWVYLPTVEGLSFASLIAWYDSSFKPKDQGVSRFIARFGTYSFSIYFFHLFFVFKLAGFVNEMWVDLSLGALIAACVASFVLMMPVGYLSYRFIERPFLRWRRPYLDLPPHAREKPAVGELANA